MLNRIGTASIIALALILSACGGGDKLAEVNGRAINRQEFDRYLQFKRIPQQDQARVQRVLDDYIQREALAGVIGDSDRIDAGQIEMELREFRKQLLISRYFESYLDDVVGEEAVRNYYNTHEDEFQEERIKAAHILIRTQEGMSQQERQARLTLAQEAYSKVKSGKSFAEAAEQYSEDTVSAKQGGELGWIKRGAIDPVFSEKVFSMSAGEISEPFATPFGFHIVKVLEAPQVVKTPFEKVKGNIAYRLRQQAKQAEMERLLEAAEVKRS